MSGRGERRTGTFLLLHILLMFFSASEVFSKLASQYPVLSPRFVLFYGLNIVVLGIYAVGWQQVIKHIPLTAAYANRAVTIFWGVVWGVLLFHEEVTPNKVIGALVVLVGVALYSAQTAREESEAGERQ